MDKKSIVIACLALCMLASSLSWMYLRMPMYVMMLTNLSKDALWLLSGYIIAEVSVVIVAGTIVDRVGPRNALLIGSSVFVGSTIGLCLSDTMNMMIFFRAIQGVGAGFLFTTAITTIPKIFPKTDRNKPNKIMTLCFALGSLYGSAAGKYFGLDNGDWKPLFYFIAIVVIVCAIAAYKNLDELPREHVRDLPGLIMTTVATAAIMIYTQVVNENFKIDSFESIAFLEFCIILVVILVIVEKRATDPIIPHGLTKNQIGLVSCMFLVGFCGIGMLQYLAMYAMASYGISIYEVSAMLLFLLAGGATTSIIGSGIVYKIGIRPLSLLGPSLCILGFFVGYFLLPCGVYGVGITLFILGLGFGCVVNEIAMSIEAVTPVEHVGAVTSLLMVGRFVGIILGMATYKALIKMPLTEYIEKNIGAVKDFDFWIFTHIHSFTEEALNIFRSAVQDCCIVAAVLVVSVLIICYFLVGKDDVDAPEWIHENPLSGNTDE